ncbi:MAG: hypothetical protein M3Y12_02925 [Bacteroidota bacterium]|nr:hypothetical protein [Bacteroidota bacterium]
MNWTKFLGRWWHHPPPAPRLFADPLDYALALTLPGSFQGERVAPAQAVFPVLLPDQQVAVTRQLAELQELATSLGQQVNRREITQGDALDRIWQAYPQLDRSNLGTLLWQAFVATR